MTLSINNSFTSTASLVSNTSLPSTRTIKPEVTSTANASSNSHANNASSLQISAEEQIKIDDFLAQLEQKNSKRESNSFFFKTILSMDRKERKKFIAGVAQTLQTNPDTANSPLKKQFKAALNHYSSIKAMMVPLREQLEHNIKSIQLEPSDDDDEIIFV